VLKLKQGIVHVGDALDRRTGSVGSDLDSAAIIGSFAERAVVHARIFHEIVYGLSGVFQLRGGRQRVEELSLVH
jgi:hypothetical protein